MIARARIFDVHEAVRRSLTARTRKLQLKHGRRALDLLNEIYGGLPIERPGIPESAAYPMPEPRGQS